MGKLAGRRILEFPSVGQLVSLFFSFILSFSHKWTDTSEWNQKSEE